MDQYLVTGDLVQHAEQLDELPVNSIIDDANGTGTNVYQKQGDNTWVGIERIAGRGPYGADSFSMGGYMRVRNREGSPPAQPPPPTLRQYQWRFRENALSGTAENGVSMEACRKGLTLLGVWDMEQFPLGPGVVVKTADNYLHLPDGTVAVNTQYADPKRETYTLFVWRRSAWANLLGRHGLGRDLKIVEYPGVPEPPGWWAEVGNADTQQQVLDFKAQAFRVGNQIKSEQSWCGTFEHIMGRVGVSQRSIREASGGGFGVSNRVGQRDAARLPAGTLLLYRGDEWSDQWAVYQRDDAVDNLARTRRVAGHRAEGAAPLSHYQSSMIVLSLPVYGAPSWMVDQPFVVTMLDLLPPGTTFDYSGVRYVILPGRMIRRNSTPHTGDHNTHVFTAAPITIHSLPEGDAS